MSQWVHYKLIGNTQLDLKKIGKVLDKRDNPEALTNIKEHIKGARPYTWDSTVDISINVHDGCSSNCSFSVMGNLRDFSSRQKQFFVEWWNYINKELVFFSGMLMVEFYDSEPLILTKKAY